MRDDYLKKAQKVITSPNVLINMVSKRTKQLRNGMKSQVESLERLDFEDMALREIIEGKITYELWSAEDKEHSKEMDMLSIR